VDIGIRTRSRERLVPERVWRTAACADDELAMPLPIEQKVPVERANRSY
jgi:hypothetical protein